MSGDCPRREELVDLLIGAGDATADQRSHLDTCATCRREWEELSRLPPLVRRGGSRLEAAAAAPPVERDFARVVGAVRRRRRRRWAGALAGAAVACAASITAVSLAGAGAGAGAADHVAVTSPAGVHLDAAFHPRGWGTAVSLAVAGLPRRALCELVVDGHGTDQVAGWWWSVDGHVEGLAAATSLHLPQITGVELLVDGRVVTTARLAHPSAG